MSEDCNKPDGIEMPRPTSAPITLAFGVVMIGAGVCLNVTMSVVGVVMFAIGLTLWIGHLVSSSGHYHEERAPPSQRPQPIVGSQGTVESMVVGKPGYRMRLPLKVHPISAGIKGGILGGLLLPLPALIWGLLTGHGIWYPVNLLAGMVWAGIDDMPVAELEQFRLPLFVVGLAIHATMSLVIGLIYGVLLPTLPPIRGGQLIWGGVLMPLMWTGISYGMMGVVNPILQQRLDWPWFIASQFLFGVTAAIVVIRSEKIAIPPAGMGPDTESLTR